MIWSAPDRFRFSASHTALTLLIGLTLNDSYVMASRPKIYSIQELISLSDCVAEIDISEVQSASTAAGVNGQVPVGSHRKTAVALTCSIRQIYFENSLNASASKSRVADTFVVQTHARSDVQKGSCIVFLRLDCTGEYRLSTDAIDSSMWHISEDGFIKLPDGFWDLKGSLDGHRNLSHQHFVAFLKTGIVTGLSQTFEANRIVAYESEKACESDSVWLEFATRSIPGESVDLNESPEEKVSFRYRIGARCNPGEVDIVGLQNAMGRNAYDTNRLFIVSGKWERGVFCVASIVDARSWQEYYR